MNTHANEVHPLTPERIPDFLAFFDHEAFTDNPKWSSCYCQCFFEDHSKIRWSERTASENRALAEIRIKDDLMQGFMAYREGKVVGWCNASPRKLLHALDSEPILNSEQIGTILCFLVAPAFRNQGVATALLNAACAGLKRSGLSIVEANPRTYAKDMAENHHGPLDMYLAAGFRVRRTDPDGSVWVERRL